MTATTKRTHKFITLDAGELLQRGDQVRHTKFAVTLRPKRKRFWHTLHMHDFRIGTPVSDYTLSEFRRLVRYSR